MATRREFFVGMAGAVAAAAAFAAREARAQQQPTNFVPMNEGAYRPVYKAPKENAMNIAWRRRSSVSPPTESLMTSNLPVSTTSRYSMIELKTTHAIGNRPYAAP